VDFATLKSKLADYLGADTNRLSDSVRGDLINQAVRELCRIGEFRFNLVNTNFPTVVGGQAYLLASFSRPLQLWYIDATSSSAEDGGRVPLDQISREEYVERYPDATDSANYGPPRHYYVAGITGSGNDHSVKLGPVPDSVITIFADYYSTPADMVNPTDENGISRSGWEAVLYRALVLATTYLMEDARVPLFEELATKHRRLLTVEQARAATDGFRPISREPG